MWKTTRVLAVAAIAAIGLAACGGSGDDSSSGVQAAQAKTTDTTAAATAAKGGAWTVGVAKTSLGDTLVDSKGMTLYLFESDTGGTSKCDASCTAIWPPLTTSGAPTADSKLDASKLGTIMRDDGSKQVTYNGHPLYLFASDQKAGDVTGQDVEDFYAIDAHGNEIKGDEDAQSNVATTTPPTTAASTSGGYGY